ncbi:MAG TPA: ATP-grasp domain-containing protein [Candidatus Limiplasma sp.]|nr:ATP-grasp domain-containing protein [Candidatus Limiplasma sp.]HPS80898.1 ATP-grasp domain-containing protein [Candidatus Limiplasma sp.]
MHTVLVTAIGSASANAVRLSLQGAGHRVIGCDIYPMAWNVTAGDVDVFLNVPLASDAEAYANALLAAVRRHRVDLVIPLTDVEVDVLSTRKEAFAAEGATVCCPDAAVADLCRDKLRMAKELGEAGVCRVIPTYTPDTLPPDTPFPLILKPVRGRSSQAQAVARTQEQLMQTLRLRDDYILQPYLTGDIYTVDCARDAFGAAVTLTRRERLRTVNGLGTAVEICPNHELDAVCKRILACANLVGVVNMEFIAHGEEYFFLEVNPRFSGGVGFSALAGYDFTQAMLRCHTGLPLLPPPAFRPMMLAQRYEMRVTSEA